MCSTKNTKTSVVNKHNTVKKLNTQRVLYVVRMEVGGGGRWGRGGGGKDKGTDHLCILAIKAM